MEEGKVYKLKNISIAIYMNKLNNDKDFYIHFDTPEQCNQFKKNYSKPIGHTCCSGKGCKLLTVTSWNEVHTLKREWLQKHSFQ